MKIVHAFILFLCLVVIILIGVFAFSPRKSYGDNIYISVFSADKIELQSTGIVNFDLRSNEAFEIIDLDTGEVLQGHRVSEDQQWEGGYLYRSKMYQKIDGKWTVDHGNDIDIHFTGPEGTRVIVTTNAIRICSYIALVLGCYLFLFILVRAKSKKKDGEVKEKYYDLNL